MQDYRDSLKNLYGNNGDVALEREMEARWRTEQRDRRVADNMKWQREQDDAVRTKRDKEARYKQILDKQVDYNDVKKFKGHQMHKIDKTFNYDDLQEWKSFGSQRYTKCVPGLNSTVNKGVANRVLDMFGKNKLIENSVSTSSLLSSQPPKRFINQNMEPLTKYPSKMRR